MAMSYGLDDRGFIPGRRKRFSILHSVQTGSMAHPGFYTIDAGGGLPGAKEAGA
jgi:hypothetical protein